MKTLLSVFMCALLLLSLSAAAAADDDETVHFLDILHNIRTDVGYYDSVDDALWAMLKDERVDLGVLRHHMTAQDLQNQWPALETLHEELAHFILFSAAVEIAEVDNPSRLDPTFKERLTTLASRVYTVASSPATGIAQVILEVSLDHFARGVSASVNQRFWTQYQEYQAQHSQQDIIAAMEGDGVEGLFVLMDAFWEQEEVEYAPQLGALEDAYPKAREAYRFQYINQYLLAPPDPLLAQWMRQRRQESSRKISEKFHAFITQWQNTPVRIEGRVTERHLPEHPVQGSMLVSREDAHTDSAPVEDGVYAWQGPAYLFWDGVASDWVPLEFQFEATEGARPDWNQESIQTTLPVLLRTAGMNLEDGVLRTSMPAIESLHFCEVSLADDVRFDLYGPRRTGNAPYDDLIRPYGRYHFVVGNASADVVLREPTKTLSIPGRAAIPEILHWEDPDYEKLFQEPDPRKAFIAYEQDMRHAVLARAEVIMGEIRRLRDEEGEAAEEQIKQLEETRDQQQDVLSDISDGGTRFREAWQAHNEEKREKEGQQQEVASDLLSTYSEMERTVSRLTFSLRDFVAIGRQVLLWSGAYSRVVWDEDRFEEREERDLTALDDAMDTFLEHKETMVQLQGQARELRSKEYDQEWIESRPASSQRTMRNMDSYGRTMEAIEPEERVQQMRDDAAASIDRFRQLLPALEALLEDLEDLLDDAPPPMDQEAAQQWSDDLETRLIQAASYGDDDEPTDMLKSTVDDVIGRFAPYLPARHLESPEWYAQVRSIVDDIQSYRAHWGMHGQKIQNTLRRAFEAMGERNLNALEQTLDDIDRFLGYGSSPAERSRRLDQLVETAQDHVKAYDDNRGYAERMDSVLKAWTSLQRLPSHWQGEYTTTVRDSFEALFDQRESLVDYAEDTDRMLPVWSRIVFGHADDAPEIEMDEALRAILPQDHWEDAHQGVRLYGTITGSETPLHVSLDIRQGNGMERSLPAVTPAFDGSIECFAPGTQNPDFGMEALYFRQPLQDPFYQLLGELPLIQWE